MGSQNPPQNPPPDVVGYGEGMPGVFDRVLSVLRPSAFREMVLKETRSAPHTYYGRGEKAWNQKIHRFEPAARVERGDLVNSSDKRFRGRAFQRHQTQHRVHFDR